MDIPKPVKQAKHRNKELTIKTEQRRCEIYKMYVRGESMMIIAQKLDIDISQVNRDLTIIRDRWIESTQLSYAQNQAEQIAKIDNLERESWESWYKSQNPIESETIRTESILRTEEVKQEKGKPKPIPTAKMVPVKTTREKHKKKQVGDPKYLDLIAWCIEMRCKILGLLKNMQINNTVTLNFDSATNPISLMPTQVVDELEDRISKVRKALPEDQYDIIESINASKELEAKEEKDGNTSSKDGL